ncbi:MAG: hypothetical protein AAFQ82_16710 [Myxococcota bacterium]
MRTAVLICGLAATACAQQSSTPAQSAPQAPQAPERLDESTVPEGLRGIPATAPTQTLSINGDKFDLYVWQVGEDYDTKVCVRYRQTGSRMWGNTCGNAPIQKVTTANMRGFMASDLGRHQRLEEDALRVRKTVIGVLNGNVTITDLEAELAKELGADRE